MEFGRSSSVFGHIPVTSCLLAGAVLGLCLKKQNQIQIYGYNNGMLYPHQLDFEIKIRRFFSKVHTIAIIILSSFLTGVVLKKNQFLISFSITNLIIAVELVGVSCVASYRLLIPVVNFLFTCFRENEDRYRGLELDRAVNNQLEETLRLNFNFDEFIHLCRENKYLFPNYLKNSEFLKLQGNEDFNDETRIELREDLTPEQKKDIIFLTFIYNKYSLEREKIRTQYAKQDLLLEQRLEIAKLLRAWGQFNVRVNGIFEHQPTAIHFNKLEKDKLKIIRESLPIWSDLLKDEPFKKVQELIKKDHTLLRYLSWPENSEDLLVEDFKKKYEELVELVEVDHYHNGLQVDENLYLHPLYIADRYNFNPGKKS